MLALPHFAGSRRSLRIASAAALAVLWTAVAGAQELKIAHQFPAVDSDLRHAAMVMMADEIGKANTGLTAKVYGGESLLKAKEQWAGLQTGTIDISIFGLSDFVAQAGEFQLLGLPGLVASLSDAKRVDSSPATAELRKAAEAKGVKALGGYWSAGAIGSADECIVEPQQMAGKAARGPSQPVDQLFQAAGGTAVSLPVNAVPDALKTGALDVISTSLMSFASFKLYSEIKCLSVPGDQGLIWIRFGVFMSKATWDKLNDAQRKAIEQATTKAMEYATAAGQKVDQDAIALYREKGVKIQPMTAEQVGHWRALAEKSSYQSFAKSVPNGAELIRAAK